jgi:hypothetical protein
MADWFLKAPGLTKRSEELNTKESQRQRSTPDLRLIESGLMEAMCSQDGKLNIHELSEETKTCMKELIPLLNDEWRKVVDAETKKEIRECFEATRERGNSAATMISTLTRMCNGEAELSDSALGSLEYSADMITSLICFIKSEEHHKEEDAAAKSILISTFASTEISKRENRLGNRIGKLLHRRG